MAQAKRDDSSDDEPPGLFSEDEASDEGGGPSAWLLRNGISKKTLEELPHIAWTELWKRRAPGVPTSFISWYRSSMLPRLSPEKPAAGYLSAPPLPRGFCEFCHFLAGHTNGSMFGCNGPPVGLPSGFKEFAIATLDGTFESSFSDFDAVGAAAATAAGRAAASSAPTTPAGSASQPRSGSAKVPEKKRKTEPRSSPPQQPPPLEIPPSGGGPAAAAPKKQSPVASHVAGIRAALKGIPGDIDSSSSGSSGTASPVPAAAAAAAATAGVEEALSEVAKIELLRAQLLKTTRQSARRSQRRAARAYGALEDNLDKLEELLTAATEREKNAEAAAAQAKEDSVLGAVRGPAVLPAEAAAAAELLKQRANKEYSQEKYAQAVELYSEAIACVRPHVSATAAAAAAPAVDASTKEEEGGSSASTVQETAAAKRFCRELYLANLCNRSLVHLKWGNVGSALWDADLVLAAEPQHVKGLYRRASARMAAKEYGKAIADLRLLLQEGQAALGQTMTGQVKKMLQQCMQEERRHGFSRAIKAAGAAGQKAAAPPPARSPSEERRAREDWDANCSGSMQAVMKSILPPGAGDLELELLKRASFTVSADGKGWKVQSAANVGRGGAAAAAGAAAGGKGSMGKKDGVAGLLPPGATVLSLRELAAASVANAISDNPEQHVQACRGILSEYLVYIFAHLRDWVALETFRRSGIYDDINVFDSININETWRKAAYEYRRLYAATSHADFLRALAAPTEPPESFGVPAEVMDPSLGLVDVLENHGLFQYQAENSVERAVPKLFGLSARRTSGSAVVNKADFLWQFDTFSEGQLRSLDWNNVVAAGGSVLAALMPLPPGPARSFYQQQESIKGSDIDLFIVGLDVAAANKKVEEMYMAIRRENDKVFAVRSLHTITFVSEFPFRKIQVVLRLYKTVAEVLHGFDVDCCSVAFDGHTVYATNRAARALCKGYNEVDFTYRSPSYELRLLKYSKRGFCVAVPGFKPNDVKPELRQTRGYYYGNVRSGLGRLVQLDTKYRQFITEARELYEYGISYDAVRTYTQEQERIHNAETRGAQDYVSFFLPFGPGWSARRTRRFVQQYIDRANSWWYRTQVCDPPRAEVRPVAVGTAEEVLNAGISTGEVCGTEWSGEDDREVAVVRHVKKDEMWMTENPGKQVLTGSFHPIQEVDAKAAWERDVYVVAEEKKEKEGAEEKKDGN